jgi:uncharacterized damage-inducible protein DinB
MEALQYPVGRFARPESFTADQRNAAIETIAALPANIRTAVRGLNAEQINTPYRPDGWTVREVVHHVADSHLNAYTRFKLGLTEDVPTVKPYNESAWAKLDDTRTTPIDVSLSLLDALHDRWSRVLRAMSPSEFARKIMHPENGPMTLDQLLAMYDWHSRHHTAHITNLRSRNNW